MPTVSLRRMTWSIKLPCVSVLSVLVWLWDSTWGCGWGIACWEGLLVGSLLLAVRGAGGGAVGLGC